MAGSKERERKRARERYERQREVRQARRRRNQRRFGIGLAVLCVLGLGVGLTTAFTGGSKPAAAKKSSAKATASASATAKASAASVAEPAHRCSYVNSSPGSKPSMPPTIPDYQAHYTATINTNRGDITIDLLNSKATCTVNSFVHLAAVNFWNNTQCHRLSNSGGLYMLQCGDPTALAKSTLSCSSSTLGTGGPGYTFADENLTGATYNAGTVAMANSGSNTNGSQFFLVFKKTTLSPNYTPFGTITSGLNILQKVAAAGTSCTYPQAGGGVPKDKVIIDSVTIKKS